MTEATQKRFELALLAASQRYPTQRIGQLISNALTMYCHPTTQHIDVFYVHNEELCVALEQYAIQNYHYAER